jgi:hypothetical protein
MFVASADVAQSVEHLIGNEEVGSSNLLISSKKKKHRINAVLFLFQLYGEIELIISRDDHSVMRGTKASAPCGR